MSEDSSDRTPTTASIPTDPLSGKFIVADILPPRKTTPIQALARPALPKQKKPISDISVQSKPIIPKAVTQTKPIEQKTVTQKKAPKKEVGNEKALDAWFKKERTVRYERKPVLNSVPLQQPQNQRSKYIYIFLVIVAVLSVGGYGISYLFARTHIDISLKSMAYELDEDLSVRTSPSGSNSIAGELIELSETGNNVFLASGMDNAEVKARGVISIYNAYNSKPQTLVANTRFETPDGKLYRIRESITIPAALIENGVLSPQTIDATVYADQPGPEYNIGLTDFTIPGFKGSSRFEGFYARSKTPLEGGFIGTSSVVTQDDIDQAQELLEQSLRNSIKERLEQVVLEGFTLLTGAEEITVESHDISAERGDAKEEFSGTMTVHARAIVFRETDFTASIIESVGLDPSMVSLHNRNDLRVSVDRRSIESGALLLTIEGTALFVWNLNTDELIQQLLASPGPDTYNDIFQKHNAIERAEVRFSPSWVRTSARSPEYVDIKTSY